MSINKKEKNSASNRLGKDPIFSLLLKLSLPGIFSMVIQALYNVVDSIYVGHLSKAALSALSLAFPIQLVLIAIGVGTGIGASSLIARLLGAGKNEKANIAAEQAIFLSVICSIIFAGIGIMFSDGVIAFFTDNGELIDLGQRYIRIILIGSAGMFVPMIANSILRGEGNTFLPMIAMLIGSVMNIILDPIFIFGMGSFKGLGIEGAAYATVLSRIISGIFVLYMLFKGGNEIVPKAKGFRPEWTSIRKIYVVGLPAIVMQVLGSFMIGGMNLIVGGMDENGVASLGIYFRLQSFVFMPVFGLNQGFMPILGYNYGHGRPDRMKEVIKYGILTAAVFTTTGFLLFQTSSEFLVSMFNPDAALILVGSDAIRTISLAFPIIGPAIIIATIFQALGKGIPSLILSFARQIVLLLPIAYFFSLLGNIHYVWFAFPISEAISFIAAVLWIRNELGHVFSTMDKNG